MNNRLPHLPIVLGWIGALKPMILKTAGMMRPCKPKAV